MIQSHSELFLQKVPGIKKERIKVILPLHRLTFLINRSYDYPEQYTENSATILLLGDMICPIVTSVVSRN